MLRNAGNTRTHSEGSMVGSLEFCVGALKTRFILVLGHTKCGAVHGATKAFLAGKTAENRGLGNALDFLLQELSGVAKHAASELGPEATADEIAAHAVKVNVFHTMNFLLKYSSHIRDQVRLGELEIHGGIYHLETGRVEFLGRSPAQHVLISAKGVLPPSLEHKFKETALLLGALGA